MIAYEEVINDEQQASPFIGFEGFSSPEDWSIISAFIDNLAEYKIVEYLLRHTWDELIEITTEQFMHGHFNEDGSKTDYGTGLSKPSVVAGIRKAIQHGLIECEVDESDRTRIRKFYRMKVFHIDEELPVEECCPDVNNFFEEELLQGKEPLHPSMGNNNSNYIHTNNNCSNLSRIQSQETLPEEVYSKKKPKGKSKYPEFIRSHVEHISNTLGDFEHTASNISQATSIYLAYIANGGNAKAFEELMQQAREITQKKSGIKHKNSHKLRNAMPYFFACLKRSAYTQEGNTV